MTEFRILTEACLLKPELLTTVLNRSVISASLQPHELQPARLLCHRDSPGQNAGIGGHALLQGIFPTQRLNPGPTVQADSSLSESAGEPWPPLPCATICVSGKTLPCHLPELRPLPRCPYPEISWERQGSQVHSLLLPRVSV